ncbi:DUF5384 family protein, partial [Escherichia sp. HC-CC]
MKYVPRCGRYLHEATADKKRDQSYEDELRSL